MCVKGKPFVRMGHKAIPTIDRDPDFILKNKIARKVGKGPLRSEERIASCRESVKFVPISLRE